MVGICFVIFSNHPVPVASFAALQLFETTTFRVTSGDFPVFPRGFLYRNITDMKLHDVKVNNHRESNLVGRMAALQDANDWN